MLVQNTKFFFFLFVNTLFCIFLHSTALNPPHAHHNVYLLLHPPSPPTVAPVTQQRQRVVVWWAVVVIFPPLARPSLCTTWGWAQTRVHLQIIPSITTLKIKCKLKETPYRESNINIFLSSDKLFQRTKFSFTLSRKRGYFCLTSFIGKVETLSTFTRWIR